MPERTYYVTLQDQSGVTVGGRIWIADTERPDLRDGFRHEARPLMDSMFKALLEEIRNA